MMKQATALFQRLFRRVSSDPGRNGVAVDLGQLTDLVRRYSVEQQQVPKDLESLVALKYLEAVPAAPPGQRFVVDRKTVEVRLE